MRSSSLAAALALSAWAEICSGAPAQTSAGAPGQGSQPAISSTIGNRDAATRAIIGKASRAWFQSEWRSYLAKFVSKDGRVGDNGSGDISHSEGQGYGLLLAAFASDSNAFALIWHWTEQHLMVRSDGLAAWKWDPQKDRVTDMNNASDGDVLLAWALAEGSRRFGRSEYRTAAERIARAIGANLFRSSSAGPLLIPGANGFAGGATNAPTVFNLSYWVFPAFADLALLAPGHDWAALKENGLKLLQSSHFGPLRLPTDWEQIGGPTPLPAPGFPAQFGYNAIRIPLYLAWDGSSPQELSRFAGLWNEKQDVGPFVIDAATGAAGQRLDGAGYKLVVALARCATSGHSIPPRLISARDGLYYPETLRLLSLIAIMERYSQCL